MGKYKVLVTYVEAGMGHIVSAEAIANALETYYPDEIEVSRTHIFKEGNDPLLLRHEKFLVNEVKRSNRHKLYFFVVMFFEANLSPDNLLKAIYSILFRREKLHMIAQFKKLSPDLVVHTHFTPAHCGIEANRKKFGGHFKNVIYVPDPLVHKLWDSRADLTLTNSQVAYHDAMELGFDPKKTLASKFLVRTKVQNTPKDKKILREKHQLPDQFTVVMASGAYAEGHLSKFADQFLKLDRKFTLLIIAGTNEDVYREFSEKAKNSGKVDLRVFHFVDDAHELYGASDLFVTKAGPNALLDSVYMGTPVMTIFYASQIERTTKELYIDTHRTGLYCPDAKDAAETLCRFLDNPTLLEPYIENCRNFVKNCIGGEKEMADAIYAELKKN